MRLSRMNIGMRGFTLIEVTITMGILAVAMSAIFALLGTGNVAHRNAVARTQAAQLASSVFEDMALRFTDPKGPYLDLDRDGEPDAWEDGNGNRIEDRFERLKGRAPAADRMPGVQGFDYELAIRYSKDPREIFVTCYVFWQDEEGGIRRIPYNRIIYLKRDPP